MNLTGYVVTIGITITAGVVIWNFIISPEENLQENVNKTDETTSTPKVTTEAWMTTYWTENGTIMVFDPANKSLSSRNYSVIDTSIAIQNSAQNDKLGVFQGFDSQNVQRVFTFDKQQKKIIHSNKVPPDFGISGFGISNVNAVLFTEPDFVECQQMSLISAVEDQVVHCRMETDICRKRPYCVASANTGDVYVFGGLTPNGELMFNSERYLAEFGTFVTIADIPLILNPSEIYHYYCIATEYKENIFVCDNIIPNNENCYIYHPANDDWETVGGFDDDRYEYKLVVVGEDLFAIGGYDGTKSIEKYNTDKKAWEVFMTLVDDFKPELAFSV